jgi:hypothetical protein
MKIQAGHWWLTPVILATQEAEIRGIAVWNQPRQIVYKILFSKKPSHTHTKKKTGGVTQGIV